MKLWKCVDVWFISCESIVHKLFHKLWWNCCDEIVVKVLFINWIEELKLGWRVMKRLLNKVVIRCVKWMVKESHSICWTIIPKNNVVKIVKFVVLKMWWRIVEDLYQVCIKLVMSVWTLLDHFSKIIRWRCEVLFSIFKWSDE